jgi:hypothetical protein
MEITVKTIEAGYASVHAPLREGGRSIKQGTLTQEKHGSTRTGTRWVARDLGGKVHAYGDTRDEAAAKLMAALLPRRY